MKYDHLYGDNNVYETILLNFPKKTAIDNAKHHFT